MHLSGTTREMRFTLILRIIPAYSISHSGSLFKTVISITDFSENDLISFNDN